MMSPSRKLALSKTKHIFCEWISQLQPPKARPQFFFSSMMIEKPRIVIIGAGIAGLAAANQLYTSSKDVFDLSLVEASTRIGGRIYTSEFCGDQIELGATWIHGIEGNPIHKIAQEINSLESLQPRECMDGLLMDRKTVAEGGFEVNPSLVESMYTLFKYLRNLIEGNESNEDSDFYKLAAKFSKNCAINGSALGKVSVGSFLRQGLDAYWESVKNKEEIKVYGNWSRKLLEEATFSIFENYLRSYNSANDLLSLDFDSEREYSKLPGEEITIAKGYTRVVESLASALPPGLVQLGQKVTRIEWKPEANHSIKNSYSSKPVKLHFSDGSIMLADHVIVTVSLGVLKAGITDQGSCMFYPPLPSSKAEAISRLGFGVVNKLFLQLSPSHGGKEESCNKFPFLQMAFHRPDSELRNKNIPWWMRKTAAIYPIYKGSSVLLSWFVGEEALEIESLSDEEIINGVSTTLSSFLSQSHEEVKSSSHEVCSENVSFGETFNRSGVKFTKVLKTKWGNDPLFLGSYSHIAVGSSGNDIDTLAEPLPKISSFISAGSPPMQILFAGEATHRSYYSTTHGAYFSGVREANRLIQHYNCLGN